MRRINRQQFASLSRDDTVRVNQLQQELNVNVVAYSLKQHEQAKCQADTISLCQVVAAGCLSSEQIGSLRSLEMKLGGDVVLVAYAKPWRRNRGVASPGRG